MSPGSIKDAQNAIHQQNMKEKHTFVNKATPPLRWSTGILSVKSFYTQNFLYFINDYNLYSK
jgi:hypothetical protein